MIALCFTFAGMIAGVLALRKLSGRPGNSRRKKFAALGLFAAILALGALALWQMRFSIGLAGGEGFARNKARDMARAQGWGIGNHIAVSSPGAKTVVVADLDGNRGFAADFEAGLRAAGVTDCMVVNLIVADSGAGRPKFMTMTGRDFNRAVDTVPDADVIVSLVGIPDGAWKAAARKKPFLVAQTGSSQERLTMELQSGRVTAAVFANPELARAVSPEYPAEIQAAFHHFFILQQ